MNCNVRQKVASKDVTRMRNKEASVNQSMFVLPSGVCLQLFSPRYILCSMFCVVFSVFCFVSSYSFSLMCNYAMFHSMASGTESFCV